MTDMRRDLRSLRVLGLALPLLVAACTPASEADTRAAQLLGELHEGWNHVDGGEETACAHGSDYSFWFRPGDPERVAIYFEGGGACWLGENCALDRNPTYDPAVDDSDAPPSEGIFDYEEPTNPIRSWSALYIPYCTGDVHLGSATVSYFLPAHDSLPASSVVIRHQGDTNARAALDWLYERVVRPTEVLVTGVSAGSLGSAVHAHDVATHYSDARVTQLGDASGGYRAPEAAARVLRTWGGETTLQRFEGLDAAHATFETFYTDEAMHNDNLRMAQINYHEDEVQLGFLQLLGVSDVPLIELLDANLDEIAMASPSFRAYMLPGSEHGIIRSDAFYSASVDGVTLRDWTAALLAGNDVPSVTCSVCRTTSSTQKP